MVHNTHKKNGSTHKIFLFNTQKKIKKMVQNTIFFVPTHTKKNRFNTHTKKKERFSTKNILRIYIYDTRTRTAYVPVYGKAKGKGANARTRSKSSTSATDSPTSVTFVV